MSVRLVVIVPLSRLRSGMCVPLSGKWFVNFVIFSQNQRSVLRIFFSYLSILCFVFLCSDLSRAPLSTNLVLCHVP